MKLLQRIVLLTMMAGVCTTVSVKAQIIKTADLEKYAKEKYGDKWLDAAANLASGLTLDKNQSLTYQQVIEAPGKTSRSLPL